jgi:hypothetical protein
MTASMVHVTNLTPPGSDNATRWLAFPLLAVGFKWVVLGRLKPGVYPLWGQYYLRWWLVDQVLRFSGRGVLRLTPALVRLHLRALGAKVGRGAVVSPDAEIGEPDLITLGRDAAVDPFARVRGRGLSLAYTPLHTPKFSCFFSWLPLKQPQKCLSAMR